MPSGNGFRPVRTLSGGHKFRSRRYRVDTDNGHDLFIGHACVLSSGAVQECTSSPAAATPVLGVIKCLYDTNGKPLTFNSTGIYLASATRGYADVIDDPNVVFSAVINATASSAMIGKLCDIVASGSGVPRTGISKMTLDATSVAAETSANAIALPFKIVGLSDTERYVYSSGARVDVIVNFHAFKQNIV